MIDEAKILVVGTYGWDHDVWTGGFYDPQLPVEWRLQYFSNLLRAVVIPWPQLAAAGAVDFDSWVEDSDDGFSFIAEIDEDFGALGADCRRRVLEGLEILGGRVLGIILTSRGDSIKWLGEFNPRWPVCLRGGSQFSQGSPPCTDDVMYTRRSDRTVDLPDCGRFAVVFSDSNDLRMMRATIYRLIEWLTPGRRAAIVFDNPKTGWSSAQQCRVLVDMLLA